MIAGLYDRCVEEIFDAVDRAFALRPVMAGMIALPLLTSPARPADLCDNLHQKDTLIIFNIPAAKLDMDFDTTAHSICYSFTPIVENLSVEPDHLCIRLGDESSPPVKLRFNSGSSYDISDVYNPEMTRQYYNFYLKECFNLGVHL